jgi:hypothetical protein
MNRLILVSVILAVISGSAFAQKESEKESLRGVKGMYILVEDIDLDAQKEGLVRGDIQEEVEKHIRAAGIGILTLKEMFASNAEPYVYVTINAAKSGDGTYVYNVSVVFRQMAILVGDENRKPRGVTTWESSAMGMIERRKMAREIRGAMNARLDAFINDYRSVNPK